MEVLLIFLKRWLFISFDICGFFCLWDYGYILKYREGNKKEDSNEKCY